MKSECITKYACLSLKARAALVFWRLRFSRNYCQRSGMLIREVFLFKIIGYTEERGRRMSLYIDFEEKESIKTNSLRGMFNYAKLCGIQKNANPDNLNTL